MNIESTLGETDPNEQRTEELLNFFRALADRNRLKIIGLLSQQEHSVEQLSAFLEVGAPTVSHHLSRLSEVGLVRARADGHCSMYSLNLEALSEMAQRLLNTDRLPALAEGVDRNSFDRKVLANFVAPDGRILAFPAQQKKLLVLLRYILKEFDPEVRYSEKTMNKILSRYNDDTARLRRSLVMFGFMDRDPGGGDYWLRGSPE